jgi:hypothetical protein
MSICELLQEYVLTKFDTRIDGETFMSQDFGPPEGGSGTQIPEEDDVLAPATPFAGGAAVEPTHDATPVADSNQAADDDEDVLGPATPFAGGAAVEPTHES